MRFEPLTSKQRGHVPNAMAAVFAMKPEAGELKSTMKCPRCRSTVRFTVFANGVSYGSCTAACGVKWPM